MDNNVHDEAYAGVIALGIAAIVLFVGLVLGFASLEQPIEGGQYTGQVIEVEYERGFIAQTTTVRLKTDPTSSNFESLCVLNAPSNPVMDDLREASRNQSEVTAHYDTPLIVPPWDCSTTPILRNLET